MPTNAIEKVLKALSPLSCKEVRQRFDALLREQLHGEEEEWIQEHLLVCDECLDAFTNKVGEKVDTGEIPLREWPSDLPLPPMELYASSSSLPAAAQEMLGVMWEEVRQLAAQGKEWAKEQLAEAERCLQGAMMLWRMPVMADAGLGQPSLVPAMDAQGTAAEVVDETWQPQGTVVPLEVRKGEEPTVTADGRFTFTLHIPETRWQGARMMCTLRLVEGQRVSFESTVQPDPSGHGGQVRFTAEGLPQGKKVTIPVELVQLFLVAPH